MTSVLQAAWDGLARGQTGGCPGPCHYLHTGAHTCPGRPVCTGKQCFILQTSSILKCSVDPQGSKAVEVLLGEKSGVMHELGQHTAFPPWTPDVCQHLSLSEVPLPQSQSG